MRKPLLLSPRCDRQRFKVARARSDYGIRRRAREEQKAPMLAALGVLPTADEYQQKAERGLTEFQRKMRQVRADGWRRVRQWRDKASDEEREIFRRHWRYLPHDPEYALDLITRIKRGNAT